MGDSGNAEGSVPHLHFEIRTPDRTPVNPYHSLVAAQRRETCAHGQRVDELGARLTVPVRGRGHPARRRRALGDRPRRAPLRRRPGRPRPARSRCRLRRRERARRRRTTTGRPGRLQPAPAVPAPARSRLRSPAGPAAPAPVVKPAPPVDEPAPAPAASEWTVEPGDSLWHIVAGVLRSVGHRGDGVARRLRLRPQPRPAVGSRRAERSARSSSSRRSGSDEFAIDRPSRFERRAGARAEPPPWLLPAARLTAGSHLRRSERVSRTQADNRFRFRQSRAPGRAWGLAKPS